MYNVRMKKVNYYLSVKQIEALKELALQTGISISEHIRRAIDIYLKLLKEEKTND